MAAVLSVVSVAVLLLGVVMLGLRLGPALTQGLFGPSYALPMDEDIDLEAGRWVIFERTGTQHRSGPLTVTENDGTVLEKTRVAIIDPSGELVNADIVATTQTINRNGSIYTGVIGFDAPVSGIYKVSLEGSSSSAIISPDIGTAIGASAAWLVVAGLGALGCLAGIILFFTGGRSVSGSHHPISGSPRAAPVGWYPDPGAPDQLRWWNGEQWARRRRQPGPTNSGAPPCGMCVRSEHRPAGLTLGPYRQRFRVDIAWRARPRRGERAR